MHFQDISIEDYLPSYLKQDTKDRIKAGLSDFFDTANDRISNYFGFYALDAPNFWMQSDLIQSIRTIDWDKNDEDYISFYSPAILVSNSCDITGDNLRTTNIKQALFAPIIPVEEYIKDLEEAFTLDQVNSFYTTLKGQLHSNLFYLPSNHKNGKDYMVLLDKIFWQPTYQLEKVENNRYLSLSNWGFYLFIFKLSYHLCRLPEEDDERHN